MTPSVVYLGSGLPLVGDEAKTMQGVGEENVFSFFKRNMGDRDFLVSANGKDLSAIDLSALVLRKLKKDAETARIDHDRNGGDHGARVFQRLSAEGDDGGRPPTPASRC